MTYDEAISKARNESNKQHRAMIVYSTKTANSGTQYDCCPDSWTMQKGYNGIARVSPSSRHWNGSRLIEIQAIVPYITDLQAELIKGDTREILV